MFLENSNLNDLLRRIKEKDMTALEEIYSAMKNCVYGLAFTYTKSHSDSEDIVQDTFLTVWKKCNTYSENNPKAWIMTIAKNLSINCIKKNKINLELDENISYNENFESTANTEMIKSMLSNLKDAECKIVVMYSYGFSHAEIAEVLSLPCSTVRWKYRNAIKKLMKLSGGGKND